MKERFEELQNDFNEICRAEVLDSEEVMALHKKIKKVERLVEETEYSIWDVYEEVNEALEELEEEMNKYM